MLTNKFVCNSSVNYVNCFISNLSILYQILKDFPNKLLKKIHKEDDGLYFKIFKWTLLPIAINIPEYENKLISWCTGRFDKEYSNLLEDSKSKNEIEEAKNWVKVHKKTKERPSQDYAKESMYCIFRYKNSYIVLLSCMHWKHIIINNNQ